MGIVFFKDFWGRGNQGDHIDVWDGEKMPKDSGANSYFSHAKMYGFGDFNAWSTDRFGSSHHNELSQRRRE